ncbi:MAG: hypothetical protein IJ762_09815 [Bacteroidaceae bacterium]|nr:hypothetical protein [Bacteroidaceae bacterium]
MQNVDFGTLLQVDENDGLVYFSGDNSNDKLCWWEFISEADMDARRQAEIKQASPSHPVDVTWLMPCPDVNNGHDLRMSSWTKICGNAACNWGTWVEDMEPTMEVFRGSWNACTDAFQVYQTAMLMPGRYKLEAQGFYRDGGYSDAANRRKTGVEQIDAYLFAGSNSVALKSIFDDAHSSRTTAFSTYTSQGYVPDTQPEASYAFQEGAYENELYFEVQTDDSGVNMTIGVKGNTSTHYDNWTVFDNFRLTYYGVGIDLQDATIYDKTDNQEGVNITYSRNFTNTEWQALYVPFEITYDNWKDNFEIARINDSHQYDDDDDGYIDRTELEVIKLKSGHTEANTPYLIKANEEGLHEINVESTTLYAAMERNIDCSSVGTLYTFKGTYTGVSGETMFGSGYYAFGGGTLHQAADSSNALNPMRWYMSVTDRDGNPKSLGEVKVKVFDENTDGLTTVLSQGERETTVYDLAGRRIEKPNRKEVYIKNGKKYLVR